MALTTDTLQIVIEVDNAGAVKSLKLAEESLKKLKKEVGATDEQLKAAEDALKGMGKAAEESAKKTAAVISMINRDTKQLRSQLSNIGASEMTQLKNNLNAQFKVIDAKIKEFAENDKITAQLINQKKILTEIAKSKTAELFQKQVAQIEDANQALRVQLESIGADRVRQLEIQAREQEKILDIQIEQLMADKGNRKENKVLIERLNQQKKIRGDILKAQIKELDAVKSAEKVEKKRTGQLKEAANSAKTAVAGAERGFSKLGASIVTLNQGLDLAVRAFQAIAVPVQKVTALFVEQTTQEQKLANTLKLTGEFTQDAIEDFKEFALQLEQTSTSTDASILRMVNLSKAIGATDDQAKILAQTAVDLGGALEGRDPFTVLQNLFDLLKGEAGELAKFFPQLQQLGKEALQAGAGVDFLVKKVEGFAEADLNTLGGRLKELNNAFTNLLESIGAFILGAEDGPDSIKELTKVVREATTLMNKLRVQFEDISFKDIAISIGVATAALTAYNKANTAYLALSMADIFTDLHDKVKTLSFSFKGLKKAMLTVVAASRKALASLIAFGTPVVVVGALIATIDILIRNLKRLDTVGEAVAGSMILSFQLVRAAVLRLQLEITELREGWAALTPTSDEFRENLSRDALKIAIELGKLRREAKQTLEVMTEISEDIDFGLVGDAVKIVSGLMKTVTEESEETEKQNKKTAESFGSMGDQLGLTADEIKTQLSAIMDSNLQLQQNIENVGASQLTQLKNALKLELKLIDKKKIEAKGNQQILMALKDQIRLTEELTRVQSLEVLKQQVAANIQTAQQLKAQLDSIGADQVDTLKIQFKLQDAILDTQIDKLKADTKSIDANRILIIQLEKQKKIRKEILDAEIKEIKGKGTGIGRAQQKGFEKGAKVIGDELGGAFTDFIGDFSGQLSGFSSEIGLILGAIQGVIDFIPEMLDMAAGIFSSLTDLGPNILSSMEGLSESMLEFFRSFKDTFAQSAAETGEVVDELMEDLIPAIIEGVVNAFGSADFWKAIGRAIRSAWSLISGGFILQFFKSLDKQWGGAMTKFFTKLGKEIANGWKTVFGLAKIQDTAEEAGQQAGTAFFESFGAGMADSFKGATEQLFSVEDIQDSLGGDTGAGKMPHEDMLERIFGDVEDKLSPWGEMLEKFAAIDKKRVSLLNTFMNFLQTQEAAMLKQVNHMLGALKGAQGELGTQFQGLLDNIRVARSGFLENFNIMLDGLKKANVSVLEKVKNWFNKIAGFDIDPLEDLRKVLKHFEGFNVDPLEDVKNFLIKLGEFIEKVSGLELPSFGGGNTGGTVTVGGVDIPKPPSIGGISAPGFALGGGVKPGGGKDTVPAMLTPGEFVINKNAARALGLDVLEQLNRGILPALPNLTGFANGGDVSGGISGLFNSGDRKAFRGNLMNQAPAPQAAPQFGDINVSVTGQNIDEDFVRNELVDMLMEEIKRRSLDRDFVISSGGIR